MTVTANRSNRGNNSARNFNWNNATNRNVNVGWRPALLEGKINDRRVHGCADEALT